jgi:polyferredoxin
MAKDKLPIPADLASGDMRMNGTAVLIRLLKICALTPWVIKNRMKEISKNFFIPNITDNTFFMIFNIIR